MKRPKPNSMIPSIGTGSQTSQSLRPRVKIATVAMTIVYLCYCALKSPFSTRWVDFPVFFITAKKAQEYQTLYDIAGHFQFKYSPWIGVLFGWFRGEGSFESVSLKWAILGFVAWIFFITQCVKSLPKRHNSITNLSLLLLVLFTNPLRLEWELGQINGVVMLVLYGTFTFLNRKTILFDLVAALMFAFAIQLKLYALIAVPIFVFRKRIFFLIATTVWIAATTLGFLAWQRGWEASLAENAAWISTLTHSTEGLIQDFSNISVFGWVARIAGGGGSVVVGAGLILAYVYHEWRNRSGDLKDSYTRFLAAIVVFNPLVWTYWVLFLIPRALRNSDELLDRLKTSRVELALFGLTAISFQMQHSKWNAAYAMFPAICLFLWLTRGRSGVDQDVLSKPDEIAPSRSR